MQFEFDEHGIESGFVRFKSDGFTAEVQVSQGRGSETRTHYFGILRQNPTQTFTESQQEQLCRIGIKKFLPAAGAVTSQCQIDLKDEPWQGELRAYPV